MTALAPEAVTVRWYDERTLEFVYIGHVTNAAITRATTEYRRLHRQRRERYHLVDVTAVTHIDAGVGERIGELLREFLQDGGSESILISGAGLARMRAISVGVSVQAPIRTFLTREDALQYLGGLL